MKHFRCGSLAGAGLPGERSSSHPPTLRPRGVAKQPVFRSLAVRMLWIGALALLCAVQGTEGTNAGLKAQVTQKGMDYARQIGMDALKDALNKITIPDQSGKANVVIGNIKYTVSGIRIQEFQFPESAVGFTPGTGMTLSISNANIKIIGNWRIKSWLFNDNGSFDVSESGVSSSVLLGVTKGDTGRPSVSKANCIFNTGALGVKFHGGASWLYNLFHRAVERPLRDQLISHLCPEVDKAIINLNSVLNTMNVTAQIDQHTAIDYSLVNAPLFTGQYMELGFKGEFYSVGHRSEPPFSPAPFSIPNQKEQMLDIGISEFSANSAAFSYFSSNILQINLTDNMMPHNFGIRLTTDLFEGLIPEVPKRYPKMSVMLQVLARKQPMLTCRPGSMSLAAYGSFLASAVLPNSTLAPLFRLDMDASVNVKVLISRSKISMSLDLSSFSLSLVNSNVGSFEVDILQKILAGLVKIVLIPKVNEKLFDGFQLPTFNKLTLINPAVTINQGYILISTDMQYSANKH